MGGACPRTHFNPPPPPPSLLNTPSTDQVVHINYINDLEYFDDLDGIFRQQPLLRMPDERLGPCQGFLRCSSFIGWMKTDGFFHLLPPQWQMMNHNPPGIAVISAALMKPRPFTHSHTRKRERERERWKRRGGGYYPQSIKRSNDAPLLLPLCIFPPLIYLPLGRS